MSSPAHQPQPSLEVESAWAALSDAREGCSLVALSRALRSLDAPCPDDALTGACLAVVDACMRIPTAPVEPVDELVGPLLLVMARCNATGELARTQHEGELLAACLRCVRACVIALDTIEARR